MRKIPTVYLRGLQNRSKVTDEVNPECQWVLDGEGVPTRKYDGTCVMLDEDGEWWARREVKPGKIPPQGFVQVNFDEATGKAMGWEPIGQSSFAKAFATVAEAPVLPGTYELCGPKVQGDPEDFRRHVLVHHSTAQRVDSAVDMDGLTPKMLVREVAHLGWEGIVWHWPQPDGTVKMAKLKVRDL